VAYLRAVSLVVWEAPSGTRFSSLLGTPEAGEAAARVGRALAALHGIRVELDSSRPLEAELGALQKRVRALEGGRPDLSARARQLLEGFRGRASGETARLSPSLRTVHPHHILLGERVALSKVEEVLLSHPLLDAADFLARLELLGLKSDCGEEAARAAERFREAYREGSAAGERGLEAFEGAALLRLACAQEKADPAGPLTERLLDRAAAHLLT
jgi:hypothetical protein